MQTSSPSPRPKLADRFWALAPGPANEDEPEPRRSVLLVRQFLAVLDAIDTAARGGRATTSLIGMLREAELAGEMSYASPEQIRGEMMDSRSLVFSTSVLLFERLTGRHPFGAQENPMRRVERIRRGEMGSGVNHFPAVPPGLRSVLVRAMGPFPEERWADLVQLRARLEQFVDQESPAPRLPGTAEATAHGDEGPTRIVRMATDFGRELMQVVDRHEKPGGPRRTGSTTGSVPALRSAEGPVIEDTYDDDDGAATVLRSVPTPAGAAGMPGVRVPRPGRPTPPPPPGAPTRNPSPTRPPAIPSLRGAGVTLPLSQTPIGTAAGWDAASVVATLPQPPPAAPAMARLSAQSDDTGSTPRIDLRPRRHWILAVGGAAVGAAIATVVFVASGRNPAPARPAVASAPSAAASATLPGTAAGTAPSLSVGAGAPPSPGAGGSAAAGPVPGQVPGTTPPPARQPSRPAAAAGQVSGTSPGTAPARQVPGTSPARQVPGTSPAGTAPEARQVPDTAPAAAEEPAGEAPDTAAGDAPADGTEAPETATPDPDAPLDPLAAGMAAAGIARGCFGPERLGKGITFGLGLSFAPGGEVRKLYFAGTAELSFAERNCLTHRLRGRSFGATTTSKVVDYRMHVDSDSQSARIP